MRDERVYHSDAGIPGAPTVHLARRVHPVIEPVLSPGAVAVQGDLVVAVGSPETLLTRWPDAPRRDHGEASLLPGLVNAHTHLSLTDLAPELADEHDFFRWLGGVARGAAELDTEAVHTAVRHGLDRTWALGTRAVGEITTRPEAADAIAADGRMGGRVYFEFLGVTADRARERFEAALAAAERFPVRPGFLEAGLSPHAPYSVWPELWREPALDRFRWSTHAAEAPGEDQLLREGTGPLRDYMTGLGVWDGTFPIPGTDALAFLETAGRLGPGGLLVHGVGIDEAAADRLAVHDAPVCLCPRSNAFLGRPVPPVALLRRAGVRLCVGTDSLASNRDLGVWGELRALRRLDPEIGTDEMLRWATLDGAEVLGLPRLGRIAPGASSAFLVARAPGRDPLRALLDGGDDPAGLLTTPGDEDGESGTIVR